MDPNATLAILRQTIKEFRELWDANEAGAVSWRTASHELADLGDTLAESAGALDDWLAGGGFTPNRWRRGERHRPGEEVTQWVQDARGWRPHDPELDCPID
jgi:hypothetical protein